jgi:hypothetical protein
MTFEKRSLVAGENTRSIMAFAKRFPYESEGHIAVEDHFAIVPVQALQVVDEIRGFPTHAIEFSGAALRKTTRSRGRDSGRRPLASSNFALDELAAGSHGGADHWLGCWQSVALACAHRQRLFLKCLGNKAKNGLCSTMPECRDDDDPRSLSAMDG